MFNENEMKFYAAEVILGLEHMHRWEKDNRWLFARRLVDQSTNWSTLILVNQMNILVDELID